ncbi:MAG: radical SAM family heme chaperone HemW [Propionicimonas sp.]|nr:radical SAM family heme chaperone HemW [Propionicimonas sp.]
MPSVPPEGEPAPADGALPPQALAGMGERTFSLYLHVPFCAVRCGYCDFNTYTAAELGSAPGASRQAYLDAVRRELELAVTVLAADSQQPVPAVDTVFFGGGTPTLLATDELAGLLGAVRDTFGLVPGAEITTEANPESVDQRGLEQLVAAGFNRLSLGMQSSVPHVLQVLDRRHTPGRVGQVVGWARAAGFGSVSLDLIYGSPGESRADWRTSLRSALDLQPDHLSAYSLIVEPGTRLAARIRRGELPGIDDDVHAEYYLVAEEELTAAGLAWYEVSNWARPGHACRHNLAYWRGGNWWGVGPGAHSHVGGERWWNLRHPSRYSARLAGGQSPAEAREVLDDQQRRVERVLLELRLAEGLELAVLTPTEARRVPTIVAAGWGLADAGRLRLTLPGRLLADGIVRDLLD